MINFSELCYAMFKRKQKKNISEARPTNVWKPKEIGQISNIDICLTFYLLFILLKNSSNVGFTVGWDRWCSDFRNAPICVNIVFRYGTPAIINGVFHIEKLTNRARRHSPCTYNSMSPFRKITHQIFGDIILTTLRPKITSKGKVIPQENKFRKMLISDEINHKNSRLWWRNECPLAKFRRFDGIFFLWGDPLIEKKTFWNSYEILNILGSKNNPYIMWPMAYLPSLLHDITCTCTAGIQSRARICRPFKEPRNRTPAWRPCTTTLFVVPARQAT